MEPEPEPEPLFLARQHPSLAAVGLGSRGVWVRSGTEGLRLVGDRNASLTVPWPHLRKVRIGMISRRLQHPLCRIVIWSDRHPSPLRLETAAPGDAGYSAVAQRIAREVLGPGGRGVLEGGVGWGPALLWPGVFGGLMLVGFVATLLDLRRGPEPIQMSSTVGVFAVLLILIEAFLWLILGSPLRPRKLAEAERLRGYLPDPVAPSAGPRPTGELRADTSPKTGRP